MKLEDQLVSRELSKRMEELGFEQESLFYWLNGIPYPRWSLGVELAKKVYTPNNCFSAYTTGELGEMLKECDHPVPYWCSQASVKSWCMFRDGEAYNINEKNEADARAQTLIHLKENNLL